jgi:hypothetical protein
MNDYRVFIGDLLALSPDSDHKMWQMALDNSRQKNIGKHDSAWEIPEFRC